MTSSMVVQAFRKLQDQYIIESAMEADSEIKRVLSHEHFQRLTQASFSPEESAALNSNPEIDFPLIVAEMNQNILKIELMLHDIHKGEHSMSLNKWMFHWFPFPHLNLMYHGECATIVIGRTLSTIRGVYNKSDLQKIIDRLWKFRWIFDACECAKWRLLALAEDEKELQNVVSLGDQAIEAFEEVEFHLNRAKESAQTLDEWIEDLYLLCPLIEYALYLHSSSDSETSKRQRFLREIRADLYTVLTISLSSGFFEGRKTYWTDSFLPEGNFSLDQLRKIKRELSYRHRARVFYPKFWFDRAMVFLQNEEDRLPIVLNELSYQHLVSCIISLSPSNAHYQIGTFDDFKILH